MTGSDEGAAVALDPTPRDQEDFAAFYLRVERPLTVALGTRYGPHIGREAAVDALSWAWEHWDRLRPMDNPSGYLYRVGQSQARRLRPRRPTRPHRDTDSTSVEEIVVEPGLDDALEALSVRQRQVVVLAHGYGCTHREIGSLLGLSPSTVQNHAERGLAKLRRRLEASRDG
ncbi:sigma-70 family RNA polymerase sigma factor [Iamia majanohamensis]|uniref:Sigma-70 family RNA polymerase sigma factor n=1 Tax=Iamia majanohamensis TaxID=467976 RepID=A0AAF0BSP2_9ACTN|nr:sigma-70 family RNA polymerase sigma factor [Iamia majanohamensis]WCO68646.1 sigma-70 family RNA polymerase sigma factor [Iamia majanohamensis]